ncbi:hypothetical protein D3C85_1222940 [compost metagenome]
MQRASVTSQVGRHLLHRAASGGQQGPDHLVHLSQQGCPGIVANTVQVLINVAGHFRIRTGQGPVEVAAAADDAIHQAVELQRSPEHTMVAAVVPWGAMAETDH